MIQEGFFLNYRWCILAQGHKKIKGTHRTTIELTRATHLTSRGDCIIGVACERGCKDFPETIRKAIIGGKKIKVTLQVEEEKDFFYGWGDARMKLSDPEDIVFRKSEFICPRTALIRCTKAAYELSPSLKIKLKNPNRILKITFEVAS